MTLLKYSDLRKRCVIGQSPEVVQLKGQEQGQGQRDSVYLKSGNHGYHHLHCLCLQ